MLAACTGNLWLSDAMVDSPFRPTEENLRGITWIKTLRMGSQLRQDYQSSLPNYTVPSRLSNRLLSEDALKCYTLGRSHASSVLRKPVFSEESWDITTLK